MRGIDALTGLRVDADTETTGLDISEHEERGHDLQPLRPAVRALTASTAGQNNCRLGAGSPVARADPFIYMWRS
ncbi:MAG TPA: hypothetical protein DCZ11_06020 [Gammaproteobacteria bacterium]|uniref:hypothetical protein n=1 Tax=Immundisolibacter sp. TaxID=1934948 RepID=UPI000E9B7CEF|nr:hypothetical protein [Gammaproteobacteria bacterium]HCZ48541.1 hypothetical protein [Gammaproteobacteria bacterium]MCH77979.1 hypothetical protein [Gammaproteobacteria bacterium]